MMNELISEVLSSSKDRFISDLKRLVDIDSVRSLPLENMPFGEKCSKVLEEASAIVSEHGFSSVNFDNYALEIQCGNSPELMLLAHLDVVPAGDGWTKDPYNMTLEGDLAFGRGTTDDKGAALACLYALEAVKKLYGEPRTGVRIVLGAGEETGSEDMDYYFSRREKLKYTLSPDADYPLINIEKGRFAPSFSREIGESAFILSIEGGDTANIVPGKAFASVKGFTKEQLDETFSNASALTGAEYSYNLIEGIAKITCKGTSAHAASPEHGNNANTALIEALLRLPYRSEDDMTRALSGLAKYFPHGDISGKACRIDMEDDESGALTMNMGILSFDGTVLRAGLDLRCPICANEDNVKARIESKLEKIGFAFEGNPGMRPVHYVPSDSALVRECLSVYEDCTGLKGECLAIGGGTYVHDIEGGVAFGIEFPGNDYRIHGADEYASIDELLLTAQMYAQIIKDLAY